MPTNAYPITDGVTHRDLFGGVPPNPDAQRPPTPDRGRLRMSLRSAGKRPLWRDEFPASSLLLHWPGCWPVVTTPATGAAPPGTTSRGVRPQGPRCHFPDPTSARRVSSSARTTAETDRGQCLRSAPNRRGCHGSHVPARNSRRQPQQAVGADGPAMVAGGRFADHTTTTAPLGSRPGHAVAAEPYSITRLDQRDHSPAVGAGRPDDAGRAGVAEPVDQPQHRRHGCCGTSPGEQVGPAPQCAQAS